MSWFWGKKKTEEEEEEEDSDEYESYSDDDDGESYSDDDDTNSMEEEEEEEEEDSDEEEDARKGKGKEDTHGDGSKSSSSFEGGGGRVYTQSLDDGDDTEKEVVEAAAAAAAANTPNNAQPKALCEISMSTDGDVSMIESEGFHTSDDDYLNTTDEDEDDDGDSYHDNNESTDGDEDVLSVDTNESDVESSDDEYAGSSQEDADITTGKENDKQPPPPNLQPSATLIRVQTVNEGIDSSDDEEEEQAEDDKEEEEEEEVTSFWEKQSLLVLAAEHDRVDILKAILTDDQDDRMALMNSGIPPLHIAISFGSTNTTQSLLRMGADPSIRPNVKEIQAHSEHSKVEIQNMGRFDGATAWELAFGNFSYQQWQSQKSSSNGRGWSLFGGGDETPNANGEKKDASPQPTKIVKPVDIAPSKREGIRHAFTAESLRCTGGDDVNRLRQLLDSGMPPSIDIGGKELYGWAVEMGALQCEELLRPVEAAKFGNDGENFVNAETKMEVTGAEINKKVDPPASVPITSRVLDRSRPGDEILIPHLINRLDEFESLASALSTCLDNLAEEVSVCHGLLLMGGGASALASHVKSLKALKHRKTEELDLTLVEWQASENELSDLVHASGPIGEEVAKIAPANLLLQSNHRRETYSRAESFRHSTRLSPEEEEAQKRQLTAQIAASENKIRKLRASIADLSDESTRDLQEVKRRGLTGGIHLVRGLREEIRDTDFQLSEAKSMNDTCRAKINLIHSRLPAPKPSQKKPSNETYSFTTLNPEATTTAENSTTNTTTTMKTSEITTAMETKVPESASAKAEESNKTPSETPTTITMGSEVTKPFSPIEREGGEPRIEDLREKIHFEVAALSVEVKPQKEESASNEKDQHVSEVFETAIEIKSNSPTNNASQITEPAIKMTTKDSITGPEDGPSLEPPEEKKVQETANPYKNNNENVQLGRPRVEEQAKEKLLSERIAIGDSQAIALRPSGTHGYFKLDLWQVILRIMGFNRAAVRRGVQVAQQQQAPTNLMIV